jgi:hypothetical protein
VRKIAAAVVDVIREKERFESKNPVAATTGFFISNIKGGS